MGFLGEIICKKTISEITHTRSRELRSFSGAIRQANKDGKIALIAEIKAKSPSVGEIRKISDVKAIARTYEENGATSISVLTESNFFGGKLKYLLDVASEVTIPVFRKDFLTDYRELAISYNLNADAVLLIVAIVGKKLTRYLNRCKEFGLEVLVEVHTQKELEIALKAGAEIIGINNRDLTTFQVDLETTKELIVDIPSDKLVISESGITSTRDVERVGSWGVNGVLVGTELMKSNRMAALVQELSSVEFK